MPSFEDKSSPQTFSWQSEDIPGAAFIDEYDIAETPFESDGEAYFSEFNRENGAYVSGSEKFFRVTVSPQIISAELDEYGMYHYKGYINCDVSQWGPGSMSFSCFAINPVYGYLYNSIDSRKIGITYDNIYKMYFEITAPTDDCTIVICPYLRDDYGDIPTCGEITNRDFCYAVENDYYYCLRLPSFDDDDEPRTIKWVR